MGGWLLHGLFGTTTDTDLKPIKSQVRRISEEIAQVARGMEVENQRLASYMTLNNHRLDNLVNITVNQQQAISELANEFNDVLGTTKDMLTVYAYVAR